MHTARALRIPLQLGMSSLMSLARSAALFGPGAVLVAAPLAALIYLGITDLPDEVGYIFVPGIVLTGYAWKHLLRARAERPSDLMLQSDGFEIRGGPSSGARVAWTDVRRVELETPPKPKEKSDDQDDSDLRQLCVYHRGLKDEERLVLAAADQALEQASLKDLAATLAAARCSGAGAPREPSKDDATALLVCPTCGAPVPPADADAVSCPYCNHQVPVGADLRRRIRDSVDVARRPDATVAKLLEQPVAGTLTAFFLAAAAFMLAAWPTALAIGTVSYLDKALSLRGALFLILFVASCIIGWFALIRGRLVDRQALRLMALEFAALAPAEAGQPYLCRQCLAPLSRQGEQVVVECVYCRTRNILGINLRREARVAREESRSLEEALQVRTAQRRTWRGVSLAAVILIGFSGWSLRSGIGHNPLTWPLEQRCKANDLAACAGWADLISQSDSTTVHVDRKRAADLYQRACDGSVASACAALAAMYLEWRKPPRGLDPKRAAQLKDRACALGDVASCKVSP